MTETVTSHTPAQKPTLGSLIDNFAKTAMVNPSVIEKHHDGVHAMIGCGLGAINELRVDAVISGISGKNPLMLYWDQAASEMTYRKMYRQLLTNAVDPENADVASPLETPEYWQVQSQFVSLDEKEMHALHELGKEISEKFIEVTGKHYAQLSDDELSALDASLFDFSDKRRRISEEFAKPANREIEEVSTVLIETQRAKLKQSL